MKLGLTALLMAVLLTSCGHRDGFNPISADAQTRQAVVGTWLTETGRLAGVITLRPDGRCLGGWTNLSASRGWGYEGEWAVVQGAVETKLTNISSWNYNTTVRPGSVHRYQILHLDDREMVEVSMGEKPQTNRWTRQK